MNRRAAGGGPRPLQVLAAIVAVSFVFGPAVAGALGVREKPIENRALSPAPTLGQGFAGFDAITPWAIDRLPGRSKAIEVKGLMDYYGYGDLPGTQVAQPLQVAGAGGSGAEAPKSGVDGASLTPTVVRGKDGQLFYGTDFTRVCADRKRFGRSLERLAELARIIEQSGRRVVFTVAPNKSSVLGESLPRAVPRGDCAREAIDAANRELDTFTDPLWVGLRPELESLHRAGRDAYWRTDSHWSPLGGSVWARSLVDRLGEKDRPEPKFIADEVTRVGDLTRLIGLTFTETVDSVEVDAGAKVIDSTPPGYTAEEIGVVTATWKTRPRSAPIAGRTLIVGDSFTRDLLPQLKPLFENGRFDRIGRLDDDVIIKHMVPADTVVLEIVQRDLSSTSLIDKSFQRKVARALGVTS